MNEGFRFANDYANATTVNPVGLAMLALACALLLVLPRRWMFVPILGLACFIAPGQRIVIASLDFTFLRIISMVALGAAIIRGLHREFRPSTLDYLVLAWIALGVAIPILRGSGGDGASANAARAGPIYYIGLGFDWTANYFVFRLLMRDWADLTRLAVTMIFLAVPVAIAFGFEMATSRNLFAVFGGVPEVTMMRDGRLRCQGAFAHPILAGCFWAGVLPLLASLLSWPQWRTFAVIGAGCAMAIILACSSSTPVISVGICMMGLAAYRFRTWVKPAFILGILGVCALSLVMQKPVYHLISRIDVVSGSTGYHRYRLIDAAVNHIHEWWLMGSGLGTEHWGRQLFDVTNFYLAQGLQGGLLLIGMLLAVLFSTFSAVGRVCRQRNLTPQRRWMMWCIGVAIAQHAVSLTAVSYFGQIWVLWFATLATAVSLAALPTPQPATEEVWEEADAPEFEEEPVVAPAAAVAADIDADLMDELPALAAPRSARDRMKQAFAN